MPAAPDIKERPIKIATLGTAWHTGGHDVAFGVRRPEDPGYAELASVQTDPLSPDDSTLEVGISDPGAEQVPNGATGARVWIHLAQRGRS